MFTLKNAQDTLAAMGIAAKVTVRGSGTFNIVVDLDTADHVTAWKKSMPVWSKLEAAGMTMLIGGHVGDHGDGFQTLRTTINFNPPDPKEPHIGFCTDCGGKLLQYRSGVQCEECSRFWSNNATP